MSHVYFIMLGLQFAFLFSFLLLRYHPISGPYCCGRTAIFCNSQEDILLLLLSKCFHNSRTLLKHNNQSLLLIIIDIANMATFINTMPVTHSNHALLTKHIAFISNIESALALLTLFSLLLLIILLC